MTHCCCHESLALLLIRLTDIRYLHQIQLQPWTLKCTYLANRLLIPENNYVSFLMSFISFFNDLLYTLYHSNQNIYIYRYVCLVKHTFFNISKQIY